MDNKARLFDLQEIDIQTAQVLFTELAPTLQVVEMTQIEHGMSTSNYIVRLSDDKKYVLRVYPRSNDHCLLEAAMYAHVRWIMNVPEVFAVDCSGSIMPNSYLIMEHIEGQTLGEHITSSRRFPDALVRDISASLGLMHRKEYSGMATLDGELEITTELGGFHSQFASLLNSYAGGHLSPETRVRFEDFLGESEKMLETLGGENVLSHGDFSFSNIIVAPDAKPYFIDFECAFSAPRFYDIGKFFRTRTPEIQRSIAPSTIMSFYEGYNSGAEQKLPRHWYAYARIADMQAMLSLINRPELPEGWVADIEAEISKTLRLVSPK